jgi:hypothetical protein
VKSAALSFGNIAGRPQLGWSSFEQVRRASGAVENGALDWNFDGILRKPGGSSDRASAGSFDDREMDFPSLESAETICHSSRFPGGALAARGAGEAQGSGSKGEFSLTPLLPSRCGR